MGKSGPDAREGRRVRHTRYCGGGRICGRQRMASWPCNGTNSPRMLMENQMAEDNIFRSVAPAISPADFDDVEREIGQPLPDAFKQHYLRFNGGAPTNTEVPGDAVWE